ncbi:hypothetical protein, partial [Bacillus cereus]|uniref:hypothetical protein n=1 Tax=Bacillus cereus TaxID=1396 RepID=UPI00196A7D1E
NAQLSVPRTSRIPTLTRNPTFSFSMILFMILYISILEWVLGFSFVTGLAEKLHKILPKMLAVHYIEKDLIT